MLLSPSLSTCVRLYIYLDLLALLLLILSRLLCSFVCIRLLACISAHTCVYHFLVTGNQFRPALSITQPVRMQVFLASGDVLQNPVSWSSDSPFWYNTLSILNHSSISLFLFCVCVYELIRDRASFSLLGRVQIVMLDASFDCFNCFERQPLGFVFLMKWEKYLDEITRSTILSSFIWFILLSFYDLH